MELGTVLFQAHSGLRFLVLLAGAIALAVLAWGWSGRRPFAGQSRASMAVFAGVLDLQVLLGVGLLLTRPFYGALMGHLMMMFAALGVVHALSVYARKQEDARRGHAVALAGVVLALLLVVGGIMSIGRSPFHMTPGAGAVAAPAE
jgi:hypothetical protein